MSEWVENTIGAITAYQKAGGTPTAGTELYYGGEIPFVVIEDMTVASKYLEQTSKSLTPRGLQSSAAWVVPQNHILYSMYATVGKPIINTIECATNQAIIALKPDKPMALDYLYYWLVFLRPNVYKFTSQTTQSNLNADTVRKLPIRYPKSKPEQQKIATILSTIDRAIERTEALIAKYRNIKAGMMHDLFTRGVQEGGTLRPKRSEAPHLYKETPIGWIPKEWKTLGMFSVTESIIDGPFGSNLKTEHYVSDFGVRVVRLQNISETEYDDSDKAYISDIHARKLYRNNVIASDILVAGLGEERYPVGRACLFPDGLGRAINKADCFRMRCDESLVLNRFMMLFLNDESARKQIRRYEQGVTRPRINTGNLKKIVAVVPSIEEQKHAVLSIEAVSKKMKTEQENLLKLQNQKSGLMHDLLSGTIKVKTEEGQRS